jgi:hypothetical protein
LDEIVSKVGKVEKKKNDKKSPKFTHWCIFQAIKHRMELQPDTHDVLQSCKERR